MADGGQASDFTVAADLNSVKSFLADIRAGDTVLVKGSRALELEKPVRELTGAGLL